jgi:subtilase family serine protease
LEHGLLPVREGRRRKPGGLARAAQGPPPPATPGAQTPPLSTPSFDCATAESFTDASGVTRVTPLGAARAYGMDRVGASATAPEQTIAVFSFDDVPDQSYWKAYVDACRFGSGPDPTITIQDVKSAPDSTKLVEILLDTTMVGAFAPANTGVVVVNGNDDDPMSWLDMAEEVVDLQATSKSAGAPLTALSMSWGTWQGECTSYTGPCNPPTMNWLTDAQFARLGAMGVSITASTGDFGSHGSHYSTKNPKNTCARPTPPGKPATSWPHSSPWVTGVGSTQWGSPTQYTGVATDSAGKVVPLSAETTWDQRPPGSNPCIYDGASGGAQSLLYPVPPWQSGFSAPGGSQPPMRQVPDVAILGSDGPYYVSPAGGKTSKFGDWWGGGTSGANPVFATGILRVNADRLAAGLPPLGYLNPILYGTLANGRGIYASAFNDITTGDNDLFDVGCCSAGQGYDMTTGLGSPDFGSAPWVALTTGRTSTAG